jgi:hypothetical protein
MSASVFRSQRHGGLVCSSLEQFEPLAFQTLHHARLNHGLYDTGKVGISFYVVGTLSKHAVHCIIEKEQIAMANQ